MEERKVQKVTDSLKKLGEETLNCPVTVELCENEFVFRCENNGSTVEVKIHNAEKLAKYMSEGASGKWDQKKKKLAEILKAANEANLRAEKVKSGKYVENRKSLILRPLRYKTVKAELKEIPHLVLGDIALVLYAVLAQHGGDYFTAKVERDTLREWDISEEDAIRNALQNTQTLYPPRIYTVEDLLDWNTDIQSIEDFRKIKKGRRGYILTNSLEINGAVSLFYPGVARAVAQALESDFYFACTSIHEAQIHSVEMVPPEVIGNSLHDTNKHCNRREEVLTYSVYRYSRENGSFSRMVNGEFREEDCWMITPSGKVRFDLTK